MSKHRRNTLKAMVILASTAAAAGNALGQGYGGPVVSPPNLDFGNVTVGTTSAAQTITVSTPTTVDATAPHGTPPLSIVSIVLPASYVRSGGTCPATGSSSSPCTIGVAFAPGSVGTAAGNVVVTASVFGQPALSGSAAVTGVGVQGASTAVPAPSLGAWSFGLLLAVLMGTGFYFVRRR